MSAARPIYLDNAATSWPKPEVVTAAMIRCIDEAGGNPGRAGHRMSIAAGRIVAEARQAIADIFGVSDPLRIAFGPNGTEALNLALLGLLRAGDHVITSAMEHNSVMRPLRALESRGVALSVVPCSPSGELDLEALEAAIDSRTKLVVLTHASNVTGAVLPVARVGRLCRDRELLFLVDAAATAGAIPIDMNALCIDLLAFTGHKSLLGPTGTGGLVVGERVELASFEPLKRGGTGSRSDLERQPEFLPDVFESGTVNAVGLAGLAAAVRWILDRRVETIAEHHQQLRSFLCRGLDQIEGVRYLALGKGVPSAGTVSITFENLSPSEAGYRLDTEHDVLCRVGLHCAPVAHRTIGTFPHGTVRLSPGIFTTTDQLSAALKGIDALARSAR